MANTVWSVFTLFVFSNLLDLSYSNGFTEEPQDTVVNVGQTATLTCVITSRSSANSLHVFWFKSESSTTDSSAITYRRQSYSEADRGKYLVGGTGYHFNLEIVNTESADSAYYYCGVFVAGNGYVHSRRARLVIHDPDIVPTCSFEPSDRSLDVGDRVTIECLPSTTTRQSLAMWKGRNGTGVRVPIINRSGDGSLSYELQLREEDRNRPYTCTPSEIYPDVNNCTVIPLLHHTIDITPRQATTELGGRARFSCETRGSPPFNQFKWIIGFGRKNVLKLTENSGRYIVATNGVSGRLTITNVINSDNNTAVRCQATNSLREKLNAQASLFVRPVPSIPVGGVSLVTIPSNSGNAVDNLKVTSSGTLAVTDNLEDSSGKDVGNGNFGGDHGSLVIGTGGPVTAIILSTTIVVTLIALAILMSWCRIRKAHRQEQCPNSSRPESTQPNRASANENGSGYTSVDPSGPLYYSHIRNNSEEHSLSKQKDAASNDVQLASLDDRQYCRRLGLFPVGRQIDDFSSTTQTNEPLYSEPDENISSHAVM